MEDLKDTDEHIADLTEGGVVSESKKRKAETVIEDVKSSRRAKQSKIDQYIEWSDNFRRSIPKPNGTMVDTLTLQYVRQMIEEDSDHIKEHYKKRLLHELNIAENSNMTNGELLWMIMISCRCNVPRKLEGGYEKKDCPVCKVAKGRVIQNDSDHTNTCPYCHACFYGSGRKKKIVLRDECKINHDIKDVLASF